MKFIILLLAIVLGAMAFGEPVLSGGFAPVEGGRWESRQGDDANKGSFSYGPFQAPAVLELSTAGFIGEKDRSLYLKRADGTRLNLRPRTIPGQDWERLRWRLPRDWAGTPVTLVAEDNDTGPGGWLGLSLPLTPSWGLGAALEAASLQVVTFWALLLPGLAVLCVLPALPALRRLLVLLLASALAAYLVFIVALFHAGAGRVAAWTLLGLPVVVLAVRARTLRLLFADREFTLPLMLSLLAALLACSGCLLYGVTENPLVVPMNRSLLGMPSDPILPMMHADLLWSGAPLRPFCGDWLTSDRPPLQAALSLLAHPLYFWKANYLQVGIAAQCWVWLGLWFLLRRLEVGPRAAALVFCGALFSGFFFFNTFFCWPKLLPAGFLLCSAGLLLGRPRAEPVALGDALLAGACVAFAMLGHGGSFFGLVALILVYVLQRRRLNLALLLAPALAAGLLMAPWFAYQKYWDPPGDRLVKFHLAGRIAIDPRPSTTVIVEAYQQTPWATIVDNKLHNFAFLICGRAWWWGNMSDATRLLLDGRSGEAFALYGRCSREAGFYHYGQTLGPLLLGLAGFVALLCRARNRARAEVQAASTLAQLCLASAVFWSLLMFESEATLVHQGTYLTGACLFAVAGIGLLGLPRWLRIATLAFNLVWFITVWVIAAPTEPVRLPGDLLTASFPGQWGVLLAALLGLLLVLRALAALEQPRAPVAAVLLSQATPQSASPPQSP